MSSLQLWQGDITKLPVDMVVNAANRSLLGGRGVDGAIHAAAGPELLASCQTLGGCAVGEAKLTAGFNLPCQWIAHTVGPQWWGGHRGEPDLLARCYKSCLELEVSVGAKSVAFPSISTGMYRYPPDAAAKVAIAVIEDCQAQQQEKLDVYLVAYDSAMLACFKQAQEKYPQT